MSGRDTAVKAASRLERAKLQVRELSENPEMAKGAVGTVVLALLRSGEEVSTASIVAELEAAATGAASKSDLAEVLARGALKVIADLRT